MKKLLLSLLFFTSFSLASYAQVKFEKGYYINEQNQRIEGLIKNSDFRTNPKEFSFKSSSKNKTIRLSTKDVKKLEIYNSSKFIKVTTHIDQSSQSIGTIDKSWKPLLKKETVFVKSLIEGQASLYSYIAGNRELFFFSVDSSAIEQLIFKQYYISRNNFGENNTFREQLLERLKCPEFNFKKLQAVTYTKKALHKIFETYNNCIGETYVTFEKNKRKATFHLNLRPRINYSSITTTDPPFSSADLSTGEKQGFGFGVETEIVLPVNKNKWSVIAEAAYQKISNQKTTENPNISGGLINATLSYSSIEVPLGARHYMFLGEKSKVFLNLGYIFDFTLSTEFESNRADGSVLQSGEFGTFGSYFGGIGYKYGNKISLELRLLTLSHRTILFADSEFNSYSLIFGYTLF